MTTGAVAEAGAVAEVPPSLYEFDLVVACPRGARLRAELLSAYARRPRECGAEADARAIFGRSEGASVLHSAWNPATNAPWVFGDAPKVQQHHVLGQSDPNVKKQY